MSCERCGGRSRLLKLCRKCAKELEGLQTKYWQNANEILTTIGGPLRPAWTELEEWRRSVDLPAEEARRLIAPISEGWLTRHAKRAISQGVSVEALDKFRRAARILGLPDSVSKPIDDQLVRAYMLGRVARGELQIHSAVSVQLPADEICYLEVPAKRWRYLQSGAHYTTGNLIVTNKKIRFSAAQHGGEIPLSRVMNAKILDAYSLALETTSPSMAGNYSVGDAVWDSAIINAAIKRDRQK